MVAHFHYVLSLGAVEVSIPAISACLSVDVRLESFMTPDRGPRTAALPRGYAVQDLIIHRGDRLIGITHPTGLKASYTHDAAGRVREGA